MALGTVLPFWPALLFTYIEPLTLIIGWYTSVFNASDFIKRQTPTAPLMPQQDGALIVTQSIGNVFLVLAGLSVVCTAVTKDTRVTRAYLLCIALGDLGHLWANYKVLGPDVFWNFGAYNDMMAGNILFTVFLHVNRLATLLGLFGRVGRR